MSGLESQVAERQQQAELLAQESARLRVCQSAQQHMLAGLESQMAILNRATSPPDTNRSEQLDAKVTAHLAAKTREFVSEASLLMLRLVDADGRVESLVDLPILARLSELVSEYLQTMVATYVTHPGIQFKMIAVHLDAPDTGHAPDPAHWEAVARKLVLTPQQLDEIEACWDLTNLTMAKLETEAAELNAQLTMALSRVAHPSSFDIMQLGERLSAVTFKQGMVYRNFSYMICCRILTPYQVARTLVHSFPWFVDTRSVVRNLVALYVRFKSAQPGSEVQASGN